MSEQTKHRRFITINPSVMGGAPCIDGTRIPAEGIARAYYDGWSAERIAEEWPGIDRAAVLAACWVTVISSQWGTWADRWWNWSKRIRPLLADCLDVDVADIPLPPQRRGDARA